MHYLGQFHYESIYIPDEEKYWSDELLRWRRAEAETNGDGKGSLNVCALAVYAHPEADFTLLSKVATKASQLKVVP